MIRPLLLRVVLFVLPFVLFGIYAYLLGQRGSAKPATPWVLLFVIGLGLVAASFIIVGLTEGETTKGVYIPAHTENGRIIPGHVEPRP
ncbi:MAG TPA: DUF6111 family protein [Rhizomicrobium sp.]|jgi:hypothetical protein|nr:DUF6111 family protein [Rhizomicrobium sp.]